MFVLPRRGYANRDVSERLDQMAQDYDDLDGFCSVAKEFLQNQPCCCHLQAEGFMVMTLWVLVEGIHSLVGTP